MVFKYGGYFYKFGDFVGVRICGFRCLLRLIRLFLLISVLICKLEVNINFWMEYYFLEKISSYLIGVGYIV